MGELKDNISEQIKTAMKAQDKLRLNVLRYLKKLFIENDTSGNPKPELDIVVGYSKKFLPKALTKNEVQKMIEDIKSSMTAPNMGAIMKVLSPQIKGRFDGKEASQMVNDALK